MTIDRMRSGLKLRWAPVALAFLSQPPAGLPRIARSLPAGCAYWKHASEGHAFYTLPEDHYNCTIGAFTHGIDLPADRQQELQSVVGTMIQLHYIAEAEVPSIPRRTEPFGIAAYAPVEQARFAPDVVVVRGNPRQLMLVSEAMRSAGGFDGSVLGRPACAMLPQSMAKQSGVASFGCIGNRVYAELHDDELYVAVPGRGLQGMLAKLDEILTANTELESFHRQRAAELAS